MKRALMIFAVALVACSSSDDESPTTTPSQDAAPETAAEASQEEGAVVDDSSAACKLVKPYATKDVDCNTCAEEKCCAEVNNCYNNLACDDSYVNCMLACVLTEDAGKAEIDACIVDCGNQYPEGKTIYETLDTCIVGKCTTECQ